MESGKPDNSELEGDRFLRLLGLDHLADVQVTTGDATFQVRNFLDVCGDHARPILLGLETLSPEDPRFEPTRNALRGLISQYVGISLETT